MEAKRFLQHPRDPVKVVSKKLTKMYQELLAVVNDLRHLVSEMKNMTYTNRIPLEYPSPRTPERNPEFEPSTRSPTDDWGSTTNTEDEDSGNRVPLRDSRKSRRRSPLERSR